jgi:polar amino acid transport system substrate-binding protein
MMRFRAGLTACLIVAIGLIGAATVGAQELPTLERILRDGKVRVGVIPMANEMVRKDPNTGEFSGYWVQAIKWMFEQVKIKIEWVETDWPVFVAGLQANKFDVSAAAALGTLQRASAVAFLDPVIYIGQSGVTLKDSGIRAIEDMDKPNVRVTFTQGSAEHHWAQANLKRAQLVPTTASSATFREAVAAKRADVALGDTASSIRFAKANASRGVVAVFTDPPLTVMPVSFAVRHADYSLKNFLDVGVRQLISRGLLKQFVRESGAEAPEAILIPKLALEPANQ